MFEDEGKTTIRICGCYLKLEKFGDLKGIVAVTEPKLEVSEFPLAERNICHIWYNPHTLLELESSHYSLSEKKKRILKTKILRKGIDI